MAIAHGGTGSSSRDRDGPDRAAQKAVQVLRDGGTPLQAACEGAVVLEDDPRFNAGTGSNVRFDGRTIEMDAACMDSAGRFGAVACLRDVRNPVLVAREVVATPHNLLAGEGALRYARRLGFSAHDVATPGARQRFDALVAGLQASGLPMPEAAWDPAALRQAWNYEVPLESVLGAQDTVGVLATDGASCAAALSTGGTIATLLGRVGDVPLPGCGLFAGPAGAVAATGDGDRIARELLAYRVYGWLEAGVGVEEALERAIARFEPEVDVGLILLRGDASCGGSNRDMAWAVRREEKA